MLKTTTFTGYMGVILIFAAQTLRADTLPSATELLNQTLWSIYSPQSNATVSISSGLGPKAVLSQIIAANIVQTSMPFYATSINQPVIAEIEKDHLIRLDFWARASGGHPVRAVLENTSAQYRAFIDLNFNAAPVWTHYTAEADSPGIDANLSVLRFQLGGAAGLVNFANVQLQDLGIDPAIIAADKALEPEAIASRINKYRMTDLTIHVIGAGGAPIPLANVTVSQTRHAFLFGRNIFQLSNSDPDTAAQTAYRNQFAALFNYATLPFYWASVEWSKGNANYDNVMWMAQWCHDHGITCKAHPLVWHQVYPSWAPLDADSAIPLLHKRVIDIITTVGDLAPYEDIVNEASTGAQGQNPPNGESAWVVRDGAPKVIETVLSWAKSADPQRKHTFIYNDYETGPANVAVWDRMKADHDLPDAVGLQSHMHSGVWSLDKLWNTTETFGKYGVPVHYTETTVLSSSVPHAVNMNGPPARDWVTDPIGEANQADYVVKFYTTLFSNPHVGAISWWDFSDRNAWLGAPAGLVRADMTPKPAYTALLNLIKHRWWTNASGKTNVDGKYQVHAFYGDYVVTITLPHGKKITQNVTMPEASGPLDLIVKTNRF